MSSNSCSDRAEIFRINSFIHKNHNFWFFLSSTVKKLLTILYFWFMKIDNCPLFNLGLISRSSEQLKYFLYVLTDIWHHLSKINPLKHENAPLKIFWSHYREFFLFSRRDFPRAFEKRPEPNLPIFWKAGSPAPKTFESRLEPILQVF